MPKVSILIVTYNPGDYIKNTLNSCLNQTYDNYDILIYDNNSSDNTVEYIKNLKSDKIKLFESTENIGPYGGLNFLLDKTDSDYIAIQDHDDIFHPDKLQESVDILEKNTKLVGCGNNTLVYNEKEKNGYIFTSQQKNHVMHTSLFFRNGKYRYENAQDHYLCDVNFQRNILTKHGDIENINKELNLHLIRKDNKNYSSNWIKLSPKYIKKFFQTYGFSLYAIQVFISLLIKKLLPKGTSQKITTNLIKKKYGILTKKQLEENEYTKELIKYFS